MTQCSSRIALSGRLPVPPRYPRVRPNTPYIPGVHDYSTGMGDTPPPSQIGDWAARTRHAYGWPSSFGPPALPHEVRTRSPWMYGGPWAAQTLAGLRGLGQSPSSTQVVQQVGGIASGAVGAIPGVGASVGSILGISATAAIPIVGAVIAGVTIGIVALMNSGCGQTCIQTSSYANQVTNLMSQNLHGYLALPAPRTYAQQQAALANFDAMWNWLQQVCGQPSMGNAGVRCIQNQQPGSCPLKVSSFGWQQNADGSWTYHENGPSGSGTNCWNYFLGFRDPIANDPTVTSGPDLVTAAGGTSTAVSPATGNPTTPSTGFPSALPGTGATTAVGVSGSENWLLLGGLALAVVALSGGLG